MHMKTTSRRRRTSPTTASRALTMSLERGSLHTFVMKVLAGRVTKKTFMDKHYHMLMGRGVLKEKYKPMEKDVIMEENKFMEKDKVKGKGNFYFKDKPHRMLMGKFMLNKCMEGGGLYMFVMTKMIMEELRVKKAIVWKGRKPKMLHIKFKDKGKLIFEGLPKVNIMAWVLLNMKGKGLHNMVDKYMGTTLTKKQHMAKMIGRCMEFGTKEGFGNVEEIIVV